MKEITSVTKWGEKVYWRNIFELTLRMFLNYKSNGNNIAISNIAYVTENGGLWDCKGTLYFHKLKFYQLIHFQKFFHEKNPQKFYHLKVLPRFCIDFKIMLNTLLYKFKKLKSFNNLL